MRPTFSQIRPSCFAWLALIASSFSAEAIRVTTWNLEWFPSGKPTKATPEVEQQRIAEAASVIEVLNPDVLLLQEVRDWETCEQLAAAVKSLKYHVIVCSAFKDRSGIVGWQQQAIIGKQYADAAWSASWTSQGAVDPPRGYVFAAFHLGERLVGFSSVHLKSNLVRGGDRFQQTQLNIRKRELAAEQLIAHVAGMQRSFSGLESFVVGGDFNTNMDQADFVSERTLPLFADAGFQNCWGNLPLSRRVTHPGKAGYPDATFDYIFVRRMNPVSIPEVTRSSLSDHWPVTLELEESR